jgi:glycerol-3-phosphate dehydrogenase (NAD(P)+)
MSNVAIIGAGMMGSAMCWPLADRGHKISLVGTPLDGFIIDSIRANRFHPTLKRSIPPEVDSFYAGDISSVIAEADWIVSGVSSFGIPWFAETVGPHLRPGQLVLSVTKGLEALEDGSLITLPQAIRCRLPPAVAAQASLNAIGGPCIAHELAARRQTGVVFTGEDPAALSRLKEELQTGYYHIWTSIDVVGVETCSALKNAYAAGVALAVGMMEASGPDGLANMYNPQAALFAQGIHEMGVMLDLLGGGLDNLHWLPGPGDLYVTVFGGRTVSLGKLLGKGIPFTEARRMLSGVTLESVEIIARIASALPKLEARGLVYGEEFPLLLHLNAIIHQAAPVDIPWNKFFNRQP